MSGDFWLGNEHIASITNTDTPFELRVDIISTDGDKLYAQYARFSVGEETTNYYLNISDYSGTAGKMTYFLLEKESIGRRKF